jgi:hypothetical protein
LIPPAATGGLEALNSQPSTLNPQPFTARTAAILQGLVNLCWTLLKWAVLAALVAAVVVVPYLYRHVDEQIRRRVEGKLASHYPGLQVTIRSAELDEGKGILIRDVSVVEPGAEGPAAELIHLEEMFLACRGDLEELITGRPEISKVLVRRPTLRVARQADGRWSTARLLPLPQLGDKPAPLVAEEGTIEIFDPLEQPAAPLSLRHVNLTLHPPDPAAANGLRRLEGTLSGDYLRLMRVEGLIDPQRLAWSVAGSLEGLELAPQLTASLPRSWTERWPALASLRGQATTHFRASDEGAASPCRFDLTGQLLQGRLDDPRLAHPLTDVRAIFRMNNQGFSVDELTAISGQSSLRMSCQGAGFGQSAPLRLEAAIRQLEFDRQLAEALPERLSDAWQKFLPAGRVNADLKLEWDGQAWKPEVTLDCLDASFSYYRFPYRLTQCTGSVVLKDDLLAADVTAYAGSQPVRVACRLADPLGDPYGWVEASGQNIPFDQKLYEAMTEKTRAVVRSFEPQGTANCFYRSWRDDPQSPHHRRLVASLNRVRVQYDKFPYPMTGVRGTLELVDDEWTFRDLEGTNDTAVVTCQGRWNCNPEAGDLDLYLNGENVPLEEELRDALQNPNMRKLWNDLRVQGMIDADVRIQRRPGQQKPSVAVLARPQSEKTSMEPTCFPYRLEKLRGLFRYEDGLVTFDPCQAQHGETSVSAAGRCQFSADGSWQFRLDNLWADRLLADRELVGALPPPLRKGVAELNLGGPLDLRGRLAFSRAAQPDAPLRSDWDLTLGLNQGSLDVGAKLENIQGEVRLVGDFDGAHVQSRGELAVDSLTWKNVHLTEVMGPIWIDDGQVLFGSVAERHLTAAEPREITARVCGGTLFGHGRIACSVGDAPPSWQIQANLSRCDLGRAAREMLAGQRDLRGTLRATVDLWGSGNNINALGGKGRAELRDANVYELPVMTSLLKIVGVRQAELSAFSDSDFNFTVEGPHVYFNQINFNGDLISLEGRGEMNLDRAIRLTFRARLGRQRLNLPLVKDLLGGASEQIMLIHVAGTLDNPVTTKEPFPTVSQALQQLQGK